MNTPRFFKYFCEKHKIMTTFRKEALQRALTRPVEMNHDNGVKVSEIFGCNVFGREAMREHLPVEIFESLMRSINEGLMIDRRIADHVASAMKAWALSKGATHYTHWFHPLNGATAEKHDAFFSRRWRSAFHCQFRRKPAYTAGTRCIKLSRAGASEILSKPADIQHGIQHHLHLFIAVRFASLQYLFLIPANHSIIKLLCLKPLTHLIKLPWMFVSTSIRMLQKYCLPWMGAGIFPD